MALKFPSFLRNAIPKPFSRADALPPSLRADIAKIYGRSGYFKGIGIPVSEKALTLGRGSPAEGRLGFDENSDDISRSHCAVLYDERTRLFLVTDLGSANGTFVMPDDRRIGAHESVACKAGQLIRLGNHNVFELVSDEAGAGAKPRDPTLDQAKYWVFISYSHQDEKVAAKLHRQLETYKIPKAVRAAVAAGGRQVPERLHPAFRDREELSASANLGEVLVNALRDSRYLVVICSRASAKSKWVNEEVRRFKALGRESRVFCVIVDGEPNASDLRGREGEECFVEALRFTVDPKGRITPQRVEPIAADMRPGKDGDEFAFLKVVAGALDVGFDALRQRDKARQRRRRLIWGGLIAIGLLVVWQNFEFLKITYNEKVALLREWRSTAEQLKTALARNEQLQNELNARKTDRGMVITLGDVLFDTGGAELTPRGTDDLQNLGIVMKKDPLLKIRVEGFTDSHGSESSNQSLSERRADSVRNALTGMGVEMGRIATVGYGKQYPVASNDNAGGRQLNRRVEIVLSDENGKFSPRH